MGFSDHGLKLVLEAVSSVCTGVRFSCSGARLGTVWPIDPGYPKVGDTDKANEGRGDHVLTWRITIPPGAEWGSAPADEVDLLDKDGLMVYRTPLPRPFHVSPSSPSVLFLNIYPRKI